MKVTALEVAKAANVSVGTVSRVLNGHPAVADEIRERVKYAVDRMKYSPLRRRSKSTSFASAAANSGRPNGESNQSLRDQPFSVRRSLSGKNIAVVLLGMDRSLETLPVVAAALHGAESAITEVGGNMLLADSPDLLRSPPWLGRERIDGVILKGALQGDAIAKGRGALFEVLRSLPSVWLLGRPDNCWGDIVGPDNLEIGRMAAAHLVSNGHRRLAFVNPKAGHVTFSRREAGFCFEASRLGVAVKSYVGGPSTGWPLPLEPARGVECVQDFVDQILAEKAESRPTAIFCPADSIVALVYRALAARSAVVAREISVISANNEISLTSGLFPTLTTIDVHPRAIGRLAVDQLIWRIANPQGPDTPPVDMCVAPTLVLGSSVACLSK